MEAGRGRGEEGAYACVSLVRVPLLPSFLPFISYHSIVVVPLPVPPRTPTARIIPPPRIDPLVLIRIPASAPNPHTLRNPCFTFAQNTHTGNSTSSKRSPFRVRRLVCESDLVEVGAEELGALDVVGAVELLVDRVRSVVSTAGRGKVIVSWDGAGRGRQARRTPWGGGGR